MSEEKTDKKKVLEQKLPDGAQWIPVLGLGLAIHDAIKGEPSYLTLSPWKSRDKEDMVASAYYRIYQVGCLSTVGGLIAKLFV